MVTGAAGMLGQKVVAAASARDWAVIGIDMPDGDLTDLTVARGLVSEAAVEAIVHCAAWTDVDGAEQLEAEASAVNETATRNVGTAAAEHGARVVAVSTDYVFDGTLTGRPYVESDEVGPLGAYGRTKLAGERALAEVCPDHAIARTAWLFGFPGKSLPDTMLTAATQRDEVSVVTDQVGSPTWTGHLAPALLDLAEADLTGVCHTAGSGRCSWHEMVVELYDRAGVDIPVRETTAREFVRPAPRPAWSVLASERDGVPVLPDWRQGLQGFLDERTDAA